MVPWLLAPRIGPKAQVAVGTYIGLCELLWTAPPQAPVGQMPIPGAGQKLTTFLSGIPKTGTTVYTTGHSLGGALSPMLALSLVEYSRLWNPDKVAVVFPYAFAGATPGDSRFSAYFRTRFPKGMERIWNALDVVPHAWDLPHLEEVATLYGSPAPKDVTQWVNAEIERVRNNGYSPLDGTPAAFSGTLQYPSPPQTMEAFLAEALYQHIDAYKVWANISHWFPKRST
jgi:hypothetical protein